MPVSIDSLNINPKSKAKRNTFAPRNRHVVFYTHTHTHTHTRKPNKEFMSFRDLSQQVIPGS
jgi:hypothetical protein